jgi:hypothetical protein
MTRLLYNRLPAFLGLDGLHSVGVGLPIASFPFYPIDACLHNAFLPFCQCSSFGGPVINWLPGSPGSGSIIQDVKSADPGP